MLKGLCSCCVRRVNMPKCHPEDGSLTLHLLFAKFFRIWALTDSWMFLLSAVSPAILKQEDKTCFKASFPLLEYSFSSTDESGPRCECSCRDADFIHEASNFPPLSLLAAVVENTEQQKQAQIRFAGLAATKRYNLLLVCDCFLSQLQPWMKTLYHFFFSLHLKI